MNENNTSKVLIDELFDRLDDWRNLPAYQLERRADIFFALYLKEILKNKYGQTIKLVIPEFPLRAGDYDPTNEHPDSSYKIDYVAVAENDKEVYLIELKTDQSSRRTKQDEYLEKAKQFNIPKIIDGVRSIYRVTKYKTKYSHLISKLIDIKWIREDGDELKTIAKSYNISVVYIQPQNKENKTNVILFSDICSYLTETNVLTERFVKSLRKWENDPNVNISD